MRDWYILHMPEISRFLGVIIAMYYNDHNPPHFHAVYGDYEITVEIETVVVNGRFPKRALYHVLEWHGLHQDELQAAWESLMEHRRPEKIAPLE